MHKVNCASYSMRADVPLQVQWAASVQPCNQYVPGSKGIQKIYFEQFAKAPSSERSFRKNSCTQTSQLTWGFQNGDSYYFSESSWDGSKHDVFKATKPCFLNFWRALYFSTAKTFCFSWRRSNYLDLNLKSNNCVQPYLQLNLLQVKQAHLPCGLSLLYFLTTSLYPRYIALYY